MISMFFITRKGPLWTTRPQLEIILSCPTNAGSFGNTFFFFYFTFDEKFWKFLLQNIWGFANAVVFIQLKKITY